MVYGILLYLILERFEVIDVQHHGIQVILFLDLVQLGVELLAAESEHALVLLQVLLVLQFKHFDFLLSRNTPLTLKIAQSLRL